MSIKAKAELCMARPDYNDPDRKDVFIWARIEGSEFIAIEFHVPYEEFTKALFSSPGECTIEMIRRREEGAQ